MKKSLIALAVLATAGTAFAQSSVTLSGDIDFGYFSYTAGGATKTTAKGFASDTSEIAINVTEDLGGGMKLAGRLGLEGMARGYGTGPTDQRITLSGGFGSVMMGSIEIGNGIRGLAQAGAPVNNMEGEILGAATLNDIIKYTSPDMSGFKLSASHTEAIGGDAAGVGYAGLNAGEARAITVGVDYAAGPMKAKLDYSKYSEAAFNNRFRVAAQYDLGVVVLGAGYEDRNFVASASGDQKKTMLGVSAPIGAATTVGAVWVKSQDKAAGSRTGYALGVSYSLSKRTSLGANFAQWEGAENVANKSSKTKLVLSHSF
jgi:predicted porin